MAADVVILIIEILLMVIMFSIGIFIWSRTKFFTGDEAFIIVFDTKHVNGRAIGLIMSEKQVAGGRVKINYIPMDPDNKTFIKDEVVPIIVKKSNMLISHRSSWSAGRNIVMIIPNDLDSIPEIFHNDKLSPLFNKVKDNNIKDIRYQSLITQNERICELARDLGNGEWSEHLMRRFLDIAVNATKLREEVDKRKSMPYIPR